VAEGGLGQGEFPDVDVLAAGVCAADVVGERAGVF
jgi:hypothetical protein